MGADAFLARGGLAHKEGIAAEFDVLKHMENLAKLRLDRLYKERQKPNPDASVMKECEEQARLVLRDLAPYKHPRLASLKVDGVMRHDLTQLSEAELLALRRIVGKTAIE